MKGEPFVKLPRDLLDSSAWRELSINARRLIDFLLIEHMRHGGRRNGFLLAPRRHLAEFGIGRHFITGAIEEVERAGLVDCRRGVGRTPSIYSLTWLPLSDGSEPSNRWRAAGAEQHPLLMGAVSSIKGCQTAPTKPVAGAEQHPQSPKSSGAKQHPPSRKDLTTEQKSGATASVPPAGGCGRATRFEPDGMVTIGGAKRTAVAPNGKRTSGNS
jgi:hypothetical protein